MNLIPHPLMQRIAPRLAARPGLPAAQTWRRRVWSRVTRPVVLPWRDDLQLHAYPDDAAGEALFLTGEVEPAATRWIASRLSAGDTFIDAGAGQGLFTLLASRRVGDAGRVVAIEPDNPRRYRLLDNLALNAAPNVAVVPAIAADRHGPSATTLDRIAYEQGLTRVGVIRIGASRAAAQILRGAAKTIDRCRPALLVHATDNALDEAQSFLRDRGYEIQRLDAHAGCFAAVPAAAASRAAA